MASVSSLARDFSWEQLHTDTEKEVTMTEDSIGSPADLSRDDSSDLGGSDSLRRRAHRISSQRGPSSPDLCPVRRGRTDTLDGISTLSGVSDLDMDLSSCHTAPPPPPPRASSPTSLPRSSSPRAPQ